MPRTMNVFPTTEDDLYKDPFPKSQPTRSFDSVIAELSAIKTAEANELRNQFWQLESQIVEMLSAHRVAQIADLEPKQHQAILAARKIAAQVSAVDEKIFASLQEHAKLNSKAIAATNNLELLQHKARESDPRMQTKGEKLVQREAISLAQKKAEDTTLAESRHLEKHNLLVFELRELRGKHAEAVRDAQELGREIERLSK